MCSVGGSCTPQLLDPSLCVQYWRELYPTVTGMDPSLCVYSSGRSCTSTVAGSITVCAVLEEAVLIQLLDPSLCVQYWRELYPLSKWIHHCVFSIEGSCTPQLLDPSLCVV